MQLKQIFGDHVNKRSRIFKCCALGEGVDEAASTEGSALTEEGKEKEKIITEGWLEGSAFQVRATIFPYKLCPATSLEKLQLVLRNLPERW